MKICRGWHVLVVGGDGKAAQWPNCDACHAGDCSSDLTMDACTALYGHARCHGFHAARDPAGDPEGWAGLYADLPRTRAGRVLIPGRAVGLHLRTGRISQVVVVDVDDDEGMATLGALLADPENTPLPDTVTAQTPSGGCHLFYRVDAEGVPLRTRPRGIGPGVDLKADGGYVVLPPGPGRRWEVPPGAVPLAPAPQWVLEISKAPTLSSARPQSKIASRIASSSLEEVDYFVMLPMLKVIDSVEGGRDNATYEAACRLADAVDAGWRDEEYALNQLRCAVACIPDQKHITPNLADLKWQSAKRRRRDT